MRQPSLFDNFEIFTYEMGNEEKKPVEVSFREIVPEITDTGYLTHSVYYYPAKFIPQVVRFCLKEFTKENDWIIDPFAGSGTVGLEAYLMRRNSILLDVNLMLQYIIPLKIYRGSNNHSKKELSDVLQVVLNEESTYIPLYQNVRYWYPDEIFEVISRYWAGVKKLECGLYKAIIQASLNKIGKMFSYAEHRTPKLFKSKYKKKYISDLLDKNWKKELDDTLFFHSFKIYDAVCRFQRATTDYEYEVNYYAGVDSSKYISDLDLEVDAIITSPPYLQAQEYIRTSKLELFWLGHNEEQIREISRLEIPYRKAERFVETPTLNKVREELENERLLKMLNSYFDHTIASLERSMNCLRQDGKACIFIGNPKIDGIEVEIWRILTEYFEDRGYRFEVVFDDKIKTRQLFGSRKNKNPDGMKSEYLLVLSKN